MAADQQRSASVRRSGYSLSKNVLHHFIPFQHQRTQIFNTQFNATSRVTYGRAAQSQSFSYRNHSHESIGFKRQQKQRQAMPRSEIIFSSLDTRFILLNAMSC